MFRLKMSSLWFWGLIITFEILLISLVGYTLVSYQGSPQLKSSIPSSLAKPTSIPDQSVVYDDLYAYRLQSLGTSNNYLITYQAYKVKNPWPERIAIGGGVLTALTLFLVAISHILNNSSEGKFAIS